MKKQEEALVDIREVMADMRSQKFETPDEKIRTFVEKIRNPYAYKVGDVTVHVSFAGNQTMDECFSNFLATM